MKRRTQHDRDDNRELVTRGEESGRKSEEKKGEGSRDSLKTEQTHNVQSSSNIQTYKEYKEWKAARKAANTK